MNKILIFLFLIAFSGCVKHPPTPAANVSVNGGKYTISGTVMLTPVDGTAPVDTVVDPPGPPGIVTADMIGINTHPWHPVKILDPIKCRRIYLSSYYFWLPDGIKPQPMQQAGTPVAWGIDDCFRNIKSNGGIILACIHQTPEWYRPTGRQDGGGDFAPLKAGLSRSAPASYKDYAEMLFQVTAREGRKVWPLDVLKVSPNARWNGDLNEKKTGMDLLNYIEPWNEPEKWWLKGSEAYFAPEETAALMSACYDGHEGTLGKYAGIKTADASMKVVMPGLTDYDWPYIQAMDVWFKSNRRDKRWPCDVANLHHYLSSTNRLGVHPQTWGMGSATTPAKDPAFSDVSRFVAFFRAMGLPLWVTETGGDSGSNSQMSYGSEEAQGAAMVETVKAYAALGVEKVFLYTAADEPGSATGGLWQSSGLLKNQASGYARKKSMDIVAAYINSLKAQAVAQPQDINRTKPISIPHQQKR